jgi:hypothetical protein
MIHAKTGNWFVENPQRGRSNNSVVLLRNETTKEEFENIMQSVIEFGEPGFIWTDNLEFIYNPCVEVGMMPITFDGRYGFQLCNLTEINGAKSLTKEIFFHQCKVASIMGTLQAGYTDFKFLKDSIDIHSKTPEFYKKINSLLWDNLTDNERSKVSNIAALIQQRDELTEDLVNFENNLIQKIRINYLDVLDKIIFEENPLLENTLNYVIKKYNSCIEKGEDLISSFDKIGMIARSKNIKFDSVFNEIGKKLKSGDTPSIKQIYYASYYISSLKN